jgi:hypothetical protein
MFPLHINKILSCAHTKILLDLLLIVLKKTPYQLALKNNKDKHVLYEPQTVINE